MGVFKKSHRNVIKIDTLISLETEITGNISGTGNYKIDGSVIGNITANGDLIISRDATVKGDISAKNIMVEGKVEGNVVAEIELVVKETANIKGTHHEAGVITVDEGSKFIGDCTVTGNTIDKRFFEPKKTEEPKEE